MVCVGCVASVYVYVWLLTAWIRLLACLFTMPSTNRANCLVSGPTSAMVGICIGGLTEVLVQRF